MDTAVNKHNFMNHTIQIYGYNLEITNIKEIIEYSRALSVECDSGKCTIQLINARGIAGENHILHATVQAIKAFERGNNMAKDMGIEICVRASAQRQISQALRILGIKKGKMDIVLVAVDCDEHLPGKVRDVLGKRNQQVLKADVNALQELYEISPEEIKSAGNIERVIMERTALLNLEI